MSIIEKYNIHGNKENFLLSSGSKASREAHALTIAEERITLSESWNSYNNIIIIIIIIIIIKHTMRSFSLYMHVIQIS